MTRVYISGPITGLPEAEYTSRFKRAEEYYKSAGFEVVNPVEIGKALQALKDEPTWEEYMMVDLEALGTCTHIALLEGWEQSPGANREKQEAERLGLEIMQIRFYH